MNKRELLKQLLNGDITPDQLREAAKRPPTAREIIIRIAELLGVKPPPEPDQKEFINEVKQLIHG